MSFHAFPGRQTAERSPRLGAPRKRILSGTILSWATSIAQDRVPDSQEAHVLSLELLCGALMSGISRKVCKVPHT